MQKRLTRDKEAALVGGVVAGLARYFKQDPTLFRLVAIAFILLTGIVPGLLVYIAGWLLMETHNGADYVIDPDEK